MSYPKKDWWGPSPPILLWVWQRKRPLGPFSPDARHMVSFYRCKAMSSAQCYVSNDTQIHFQLHFLLKNDFSGKFYMWPPDWINPPGHVAGNMPYLTLLMGCEDCKPPQSTKPAGPDVTYGHKQECCSINTLLFNMVIYWYGYFYQMPSREIIW